VVADLLIFQAIATSLDDLSGPQYASDACGAQGHVSKPWKRCGTGVAVVTTCRGGTRPNHAPPGATQPDLLGAGVSLTARAERVQRSGGSRDAGSKCARARSPASANSTRRRVRRRAEARGGVADLLVRGRLEVVDLW